MVSLGRFIAFRRLARVMAVACALNLTSASSINFAEPALATGEVMSEVKMLKPDGSMQMWYYNCERLFRYPIPTNFDFAYIDKTGIAYQLIKSGRYYFLSRPRRFGKSLFADMLAELFEGNKELFEGLEIYDKWDWEKKFPVIKISFGTGNTKSEK